MLEQYLEYLQEGFFSTEKLKSQGMKVASKTYKECMKRTKKSGDRFLVRNSKCHNEASKKAIPFWKSAMSKCTDDKCKKKIQKVIDIHIKSIAREEKKIRKWTK